LKNPKFFAQKIANVRN